jgi:hypothetical protein
MNYTIWLILIVSLIISVIFILFKIKKCIVPMEYQFLLEPPPFFDDRRNVECLLNRHIDGILEISESSRPPALNRYLDQLYAYRNARTRETARLLRASWMLLMRELRR